MKKKILVGFAVALTLSTSTVFAGGVSTKANVVFNNVDVLVDGQRIDASNIVYNGTTYIPLRKVSEATGLTVNYDEATREINLVSGGEVSVTTKKERTASSNEQATFMLNSVTVYVDDVLVEADNILYNGTTYLPLRSIAEALGNTVLYEETSKTVLLASNDEQVQKDKLMAEQLSSGQQTPPTGELPTGEKPQGEPPTGERPELPDGVTKPEGEAMQMPEGMPEGGQGLEPNSEEYKAWFNGLTEEEQAIVLEFEKNRPQPPALPTTAQ